MHQTVHPPKLEMGEPAKTKSHEPIFLDKQKKVSFPPKIHSYATQYNDLITYK